MSKENMAQKKLWQKPELIVLVRSKPEEAVLAACKKTTGTGVTTRRGAATCFWTPSASCSVPCNLVASS